MYPNGEISDPYVWVLANPKPLPIQSKQKIFKIIYRDREGRITGRNLRPVNATVYK